MVAINRVSKTVKGGRIFKFAALVVVGDGNGTVGFGIGKAGEVPGCDPQGHRGCEEEPDEGRAPRKHDPHEITGKYGAGRVLLKPAARYRRYRRRPGPRGCGSAGIRDIRTKALRSNNPCNVVRATLEGLSKLRTAEEVAAIRGEVRQRDSVKGLQAWNS